MTSEEISPPTHHSLADYVKGVHAHLRQRVKDGVDVDRVWNEHIKLEQEMRSRYASSMHQLATDHWSHSDEVEKNNRIEWIRRSVLAYFFGHEQCNAIISNDGSGLFLAVSKDIRGRMFDTGQLAKDPESGRPLLTEVDKNAVSTEANRRWHRCVVGEQTSGNDDELKRRSLSLLDVGSCYDPFARFEDFNAFAVDITPSTPSVVEMDFVTVPVIEAEINDDNVEENCIVESSSPPPPFRDSTHLIANSFHVVVFSLLLEYFPSPRQRWICCLKANRTLKMDGVLVIVTPDSSHVNKRAPQMKSWRNALETHLGFKRWKYEKLTHLHCMMYRKVDDIRGAVDDFKEYFPLLYIPQDHNNSGTTPVGDGASLRS